MEGGGYGLQRGRSMLHLHESISKQRRNLDGHVKPQVARTKKHVSTSHLSRLECPDPKKTLISNHDMSFSVIRSLASIVNVVRKPR